MTRLKPIKRSVFLKIIESYGFECKRVKGDHFIFDTDPPGPRPFPTVLLDEIPKDHIFNFIRSLGVSKDEFLSHELLLSKSQKRSKKNKQKQQNITIE